MSHQHPFRFGVQFHQTGSACAWAETARKAEALGYDTFVMPDHVGVLAFGSALAAAANATSTLHIGTFVLDNDFRHPAFVAQEAATLDLLSDGRFELGLGAGWHGPDYTTTGIPFDPPGVRVGRFQESVRIIKALFGNDPVTFHGQHYTITDLPPMPQRPRPPLLIGAGGKRMLAFAAREADAIGLLSSARPDGSGFFLDDITAEATDVKVARVRDAAGDRFPLLELNILLQRLMVTDQAIAEAEQISEQWNLPARDILDAPPVLIGTVDQIVETLQERRERFGISYIVARGEWLESFAPVVARLAGT